MSCQNITEIINNVNENCHNEEALQIKENCEYICLTSIFYLYSQCMSFLVQNNLKDTFKDIISWCYWKKNMNINN